MIESFLTKQALELLARMIQHEKDWIEYQFQFKPCLYIGTSDATLMDSSFKKPDKDPSKWSDLDKDCELLEQLGKLIPAMSKKQKHVYHIPKEYEFIHQMRKKA